jgi:hypothetical protein
MSALDGDERSVSDHCRLNIGQTLTCIHRIAGWQDSRAVPDLMGNEKSLDLTCYRTQTPTSFNL